MAIWSRGNANILGDLDTPLIHCSTNPLHRCQAKDQPNLAATLTHPGFSNVSCVDKKQMWWWWAIYSPDNQRRAKFQHTLQLPPNGASVNMWCSTL